MQHSAISQSGQAAVARAAAFAQSRARDSTAVQNERWGRRSLSPKWASYVGPDYPFDLLGWSRKGNRRRRLQLWV